ncbi:hypothetical protein AN1V17_29010 [Vallitalea sediminicola]
MDLVYGTYNSSKFQSMGKMLKGLDVNLIHLDSFDMKITEAEENGKEPLDNAFAKAKTYYNQLKRPVFSCDSGLFFDNVDEKDQPGVYIKRVKGKVLTDLEMQSYYSDLAREYGGRLTAYYKNSICLVMNENTVYRYDGEDLNSEKFYMVTKPHDIFRKGFPLDSLSVEMKSMKYYYDLDEGENDNLGVISGFRKFFIEILKL